MSRRPGDRLVRLSAGTAAKLDEYQRLSRYWRSIDYALGKLLNDAILGLEPIAVEVNRSRSREVNTPIGRSEVNQRTEVNPRSAVNTKAVPARLAVNTKLERQPCQWCGRGIPPRRRDTGFCKRACERDQHRADVASAASEREYVTSGGAS
jgi:hypothetical protein